VLAAGVRGADGGREPSAEGGPGRERGTGKGSVASDVDLRENPDQCEREQVVDGSCDDCGNDDGEGVAANTAGVVQRAPPRQTLQRGPACISASVAGRQMPPKAAARLAAAATSAAQVRIKIP
jgi:hypothetical protein